MEIIITIIVTIIGRETKCLSAVIYKRDCLIGVSGWVVGSRSWVIGRG